MASTPVATSSALGGGPQPHAIAADIAVADFEVVPFDRKAHVNPSLALGRSARRTATRLRLLAPTSADTQAPSVVGAVAEIRRKPTKISAEQGAPSYEPEQFPGAGMADCSDYGHCASPWGWCP
jgi:hypothetical protein